MEKEASKNAIKNLQEEVELIGSPDNSDVDDAVQLMSQFKANETPKSRRLVKEAPQTPKSHGVALPEDVQTPRRSVRKSIKPQQDYEDIVAKKTSRSQKKKDKHSSLVEEEEKEDAPKWTPAKVGRVSQKRKSRKSRKTAQKKLQIEEQKIAIDEQVLEVIANDEDENKENVEPQELIKNRKVPKENDNKMDGRRSQELVIVSSAEKIKAADKRLVAEQRLKSLEKEKPILTIAAVEETTEKIEILAVETVVEKETSTRSENQTIVELGLTPINLELSVALKSSVEESLILCEGIELVNQKETPQNNDSTFNTSDCIIISPEAETNVPMEQLVQTKNNKDESIFMQPLLLSDDEIEEEPAAKVPRIIITNSEDEEALTNNTPQQRPKPYRFPTPYKSKEAKNLSFEFNEHIENNDDISHPPPPSILTKFTTLEPKDIVLRSIRKKRSLSACNERTQRKQMNRVTFHSPANQTALIDELDLKIAKSAKKDVDSYYAFKQRNVALAAAPRANNITNRRKRSFSVDELQTRYKLKPATPKKLTPLKVQSRSKIPNFAAIHQRQFNKMENLVDHVTRKAERAKILNSATKLRLASAQKSGFPAKDQNIYSSSTGSSADVDSTARVGKPKALKKINLADITVKLAPVAATNTAKLIDDENNESQSFALNLPKPQLIKNCAVVKPMPAIKKTPKKLFKPAATIVHHPKPAFNLSTHIDKTAANVSILGKTSSTVSSMAYAAVKPAQFSADKTTAQRQRHMDMFKGRIGGRAARNNTVRSDKTSEIIQGVRSNRRFNLQMQHRKNLMDHTD